MNNNRQHSFDPMALGSMLNEYPSSTTNGTAGLEEIPRPRSHSFQLPPLVRPHPSRRHTGPFPAMQPIPDRSISQYGTLPPLLDTESFQQSMPSNLARRTSTARAPRPKYEEQQGFFIWYHRTDLGEPWDEVLREFEAEFGQRRPKGGLQCKFYRLLDQWEVEKVRAQARSAQDSPRDRIGAYGVVQRTTERCRWMRPEHYHARALPRFTTRGHSPASATSCAGCPECE